MESENEYNSSDEEELDEKYIFPHGKLLYPLSNKEEYIHGWEIRKIKNLNCLIFSFFVKFWSKT